MGILLLGARPDADTPVLTWVSGTTSNQPSLSIVFPDILVWGTTLNFEYANNSGFTGATTISPILDDTDAITRALSLGEAALADGTWYIRVQKDGGPWSNTVTKTIDAAPTLTAPTGVKSGQTTATLGVTTDQDNGTLYWVTTTTSTPPTATQVKAGQDSAGAAADADGSQAVSGTGAQVINATGLTLGTTVYAHFMHEDAVTNKSAVVSSAEFTTDSAVVKTWRYTNRSSDGSATVATFSSIDLGADAVDRLVVVSMALQKGTTLTSVVVDAAGANVTLTKDVGTLADSNAFIYSGLVPTGSGTHTITITHSGSAGFTRRDIVVHTLTGLNSTTPKQTASGSSVTSIPIDVDGGDFLFAMDWLSVGTGDYSGSTQAPDGARIVGALAGGAQADWRITVGNAAFAVTPGGTNPSLVAASYR